jgi:transcriptional regulator with XRE-family HTH domain
MTKDRAAAEVPGGTPVDQRVMALGSKRPGFDTAGFDAALRRSAEARGMTMKDVAAETGVSETTLSRMHNHGRSPDAASLAALSAWAGINPARFSDRAVKPRPIDWEAINRILTAPTKHPCAFCGGRGSYGFPGRTCEWCERHNDSFSRHQQAVTKYPKGASGRNLLGLGCKR